MSRPIAATPRVRGKDAEEIFGRMRSVSPRDEKALARRTKELDAVGRKFKKVKLKRAG